MRRRTLGATLVAAVLVSLCLPMPPVARAAGSGASLASGAAAAATPAEAAMRQRPPQDDIIYLVMTDRFFDGDKSNDIDVNEGDPQAYHGGDLQGVIDKLDYIQSLGVNAIWITPVVQNQDRGYHGYWATDFEKVDQHLGTLQTLQTLVSQAHSRGIKVLLDVVVNHTGPKHPWASDPAKFDWFHHIGPISDWNDQQNIEQGQLYDLPDLAQENPAVADYLIRVDKRWITETDVDGFRLDTVRHVPKTFWQRFAAEMHATKPGFFLMGEAWNSDPGYLAGYQAVGLDSLLDFPRQQAIQSVFQSSSDPRILHDVQAEEDKAFADSSLVTTFIDNHDMPRFVTQAGADGEQKLRAALAYLLTTKGIPVVYYGTEVAMQGGADPDNRQDMAFGSNPGMLRYFQELTALRNSEVALRRGDYVPVDVEPGSAVLAYLRLPRAAADADGIGTVAGVGGKAETADTTASGKAEPLLVAINPGDKPQTVTLTVPDSAGLKGRLEDALGADHQALSLKSGSGSATLTLTLQPYQAVVLRPLGGMFSEQAAGIALLVLLLLLVALAAYIHARQVRGVATR